MTAERYKRISHGVTPERPIQLKWDQWETVGPGQRDMHLEVELGIVVAGRMRREFSGVELQLGSGDLWFNGIWEPHFAYVEEAPLQLMIIHLHPSILADTAFREAAGINWLAPFTVPAAERPHGALLSRRTVDHYVAKLMHHLDATTALDLAAVHILALSILRDVMAVWGDERCLRGPAGTAGSRLEKVLGLVFREQRLITVDDVAALCGMSRAGFNRFFEGAMGIRFAQFALHHRLSQAAGDLLRTDAPVKEIAETWGFTDTSHFHHRFQDVYGVTPSQYRKRGVSEVP